MGSSHSPHFILGNFPRVSEDKRGTTIMSEQNQDFILRFSRVQHITGLPRSTLYDKMNAGRFPKPISLGGGRAVGWLSSEVSQWISEQAEASRRTA
jgi:prophage regulatory protein